ncbi:hypothetical protein EIP91_012327 [Steccherinum ochraceum]|uniref:Uncharacterized protein n=1 Tax=Steccherinum ochraceum TaxID=92696 RepID=A0A4R0RJ21_9APHY|nr:hypothetical protein EIP91_012327 [Steccherinum ochraceum]
MNLPQLCAKPQRDSYADCDSTQESGQRASPSSSPIGQLPPEILRDVFVRYVTEETTEDNRGWSSPSYAWLKITWVCRFWREVALEVPQIWSTIYVRQRTTVEMVRAYLERARNVPLQVTITRRGSASADLLEALLPDIGRSRSLSLDMPFEKLELLGGSFPSRAPALQLLRLQAPHAYRSSNSRLLPSSFFKCATPVLEELVVARYRLPWSKNLLPPSLVRLSIHSNSSMHSSSIPEIVDCITSLPVLQELNLINVLPLTQASTRFPFHHTSKKRVFASLQRLALTDAALTSAYFLHICAFALPIATNLVCVSPIDHRSVLRLATSLVPILEVVSPMLLVINSRSVAFYSAVKPGADPRSAGTLEADVAEPHMMITLGHSGDLADDFFQDRMCAQLPLATVQLLHLDDACNVGFSAWRDMMEYMPHLDTLLVSTSTVSKDSFDRNDILELLGTPTNTHTGAFLIPELAHLVLDSFVVRDHDEEGFHFVTDLKDVIDLRAKAGFKVERVTIRDCYNMGSDDITLLADYVNVVWDGKVQFCGPSHGDSSDSCCEDSEGGEGAGTEDDVNGGG